MMGRILCIAAAVCLFALSGVAAADQGGTNKVLSLENTPVISVSIDATSYDGQPLRINVELNDTAAANGTSVSWTTQTCTNDLVCTLPLDHELVSIDEGRNWSGEMMPPEDHSYVNYRIMLVHADGSEQTLPEEGFGGKVWSDCWYTIEEGWGGLGCSDDQPVGSGTNAEDRMVPAAGTLLTAAAVGLAAVTRRDK